MLSRSAERLYWLAKYLERTENTARILGVYTNLLFDLPKEIELSWPTLLTVFDANETFSHSYTEQNEQNILRFLLSDTDNPSSLFSSLNYARENIRTSREHLPYEAWQLVNEMFLYVKKNVGSANNRRGRVLIFKEIMRGCQRFSGFLSGAMSHDAAYVFIRMGRNLERADMTTRILDISSVLLADDLSDKVKQYENTLWLNVLKSLSAVLMYRKHCYYRINSADVLDYLLNDMRFPRSVNHCITEVEKCMTMLPRSDQSVIDLKALSDFLMTHDYSKIDHEQLHHLLDHIQLRLGLTHNQIANTWFLAA
jgi:uncharacterized alpha-E superfamily protein